MRGFEYDNIHTANDWSLVLTAKAIDPPEPKLYEVDLEGADGSLDLSESLAGEIRFKDRTVSASYCMTEGTLPERIALMTKIMIFLHGRKRKIVDPDDPEHYFIGRSVVNSVKHTQAYSTFAVTSTCEPWRYYREKIKRHCNVNSVTAHKLVFTNEGAKTTCPLLTITGIVSFVINGETVTLTAGQYRLTSLKFYSGVNEVSVYGSGAVTFEYEEADL